MKVEVVESSPKWSNEFNLEKFAIIRGRYPYLINRKTLVNHEKVGVALLW